MGAGPGENTLTRTVSVDIEGSFIEALQTAQSEMLQEQITELKSELAERKSEIEERKLEIEELRKELTYYKNRVQDQ